MLIALNALFIMCSLKKSSEAEQETDENQEQAADAFHMLMAETFHPFKDSGNLQPVKMHADALADAAEKWANAPLPERLRREDVKVKLEKLKTDTRSLAALVKTGSDEEIGAALEKLHEFFHELLGIWSFKPEGNEKHHP